MKTKDKKLRGFATLDQCVRRAIMDIGAGLERYEQFLGWSIEQYNDFHYDMAQEVKTVELPMTAWKAIEWPDDYVDWVLVGVRIGGQIAVFTNDENIALAFDGNEDTEPDPNQLFDGTYQTTPGDFLSNSKYYFFNTNDHGEDTGGVFGLGVKDNGLGYYRVNRQRREIQFNPAVDSSKKVYFEYISNGYNPCAKTTINLYAAKLNKLYIHWQRCLYSKGSRSEAQEAERLYWDEWRRVQDRMNPLTIDDVLEAARGGYMASPYI